MNTEWTFNLGFVSAENFNALMNCSFDRITKSAGTFQIRGRKPLLYFLVFFLWSLIFVLVSLTFSPRSPCFCLAKVINSNPLLPGFH